MLTPICSSVQNATNITNNFSFLQTIANPPLMSENINGGEIFYDDTIIIKESCKEEDSVYHRNLFYNPLGAIQLAL